jgi:hypothetical protein
LTALDRLAELERPVELKWFPEVLRVLDRLRLPLRLTPVECPKPL